jgi:transposase-like protein
MSLVQLDNEAIGGSGVVVEIDESKFSKRKYNCGRSLREGWVFGGIERQSRKMFFSFVIDRTEITLLDIIKRRILPGSVIHCDMFRSYVNLELHGYTVFRVNHSENFVDPSTGAHTQNIESAWGRLKRFMRSIGSNLGEYTDEYMMESLYREKHLNDMFDSLLHDISLLFPPK